MENKRHIVEWALTLLSVVAFSLIAIGQLAGQPVTSGTGAVLPKIKLIKQFDKDGDNRLDTAERHAAMAHLSANPQLRRPGRPPVGEPKTPVPGPKLRPADVESYPNTFPLFDAGTLRTLFLEFDDADWEQQLAAFHRTDVLVPAKLTVDGTPYRDVGVHFRGNNSFSTVRDGWKRSLTLALDFVHPNQALGGYHGLHLLNFNEDPSFLRTVLYLEVARHYFPAPKANFLRVVINGECWGVYANQQKFDKEFVRENFGTPQGTRWRSPNNSVGGGFGFLGGDVAVYKRWYDIRSKDDPKAWADLARLCKLLNTTPPEKLANTLDPILDLDNVLAFLALDVTLMNNDGYWNDGSDFAIYKDIKGRFHVLPHDANEGFRPVKSRNKDVPSVGIRLEPFAATSDPNKALRHKLLAAPELRTRYLHFVRDIAEKWLDWNKLGPLSGKYRSLIAADVERDTHKLSSNAEFQTAITGQADGAPPSQMPLKEFADKRRAFLLNHPEIKNLNRPRP